MWLSEVIQDSYRQWTDGNIVILNAPTGSGKTYFVLNKLLPFAASQGQELVYLTNRTALREQVLRAQNQAYTDHLHVLNYQAFEKTILTSSSTSEKAQFIYRSKYLVMDEAHYFLSDAAFNGDIAQSLSHLKYLHSTPLNKILIFITATPEYLFLSLSAAKIIDRSSPKFSFFELIGDCCEFCRYDKPCPQNPPHNYNCRDFPGDKYYGCADFLSNAPIIKRLSLPETLLRYKELSDRQVFNVNHQTNIFDVDLASAADYYVHNFKNYFQNFFKSKYETFFSQCKAEHQFITMPVDYSYILPTYFSHLGQLCDAILHTPENEKWLIFVSSIKLGEDLEDNLLQHAEHSDKNIDVVFISSASKSTSAGGLRYPPKDYVAYQNIIESSSTTNRVTISTAVLDNGINLKDPALKHIAILEMNQTSFLQMLGRKRIDREHNEQIHLYLWAKDIGEVKAYFSKSILRYVKFLTEYEFIKKIGNSLDSLFDFYNLENFSTSYISGSGFKAPYSFYMKPKSPDYVPKIMIADYATRFFEPNPISTARLTYDYYRFAAMLEEYTNISDKDKIAAKETHWLKYQLAWLNLEYNPKCWIDYPILLASRAEILRLLHYQILNKEEQAVLRNAFIRFARANHPPLISTQSKASISTINRILPAAGFPYQLKSIHKGRKTYWKPVLIQDK